MVNCNHVEKTSHDFDIDVNAWKKLKKSRKEKDFSNFMMNHPDSKYIDSIIHRFINIQDSLEYDYFTCEKYSVEIHPIDANQVLFNHELKQKDSLESLTYNYLTSKLVNNQEIKIPRSYKYGNFSTGKIFIVIMPDSTKNRHLPNAIVQVNKGIKKYRDFLVNDWYGKKYAQLNDSTKYYIDRLIENKISLMEYYEQNPPRCQISN